MIRAICFDLDGTLLGVDSEFFMKHYMGGIARVIPGRTPEQVVGAIMGTLRDVMRANKPGVTVEQRFAEGLEQYLDMPYQQQEPLYLRYYAEQFPLLAQHMTIRPQAQAAVQAARAKGLKVALATNPVFPGVATRQRMAWAGLNEADFDVATFYEDCCFTKPHPEYYVHEVLAKLGVAPEEALMIGNDAKEDMAPAHALGMGTFFLNVYPEHVDSPRCWDAEGDYDEMLRMVEGLPGIG